MVELMTAVLAGNLMTALAIYGFVGIFRSDRERSGLPDAHYLICAACPLVFLVLGILATQPLPPSLDAIAAQRSGAQIEAPLAQD